MKQELIEFSSIVRLLKWRIEMSNTEGDEINILKRLSLGLKVKMQGILQNHICKSISRTILHQYRNTSTIKL